MLMDVVHAFQVLGQTAFGFCFALVLLSVLFIIADVAADAVLVWWRQRQWRRRRTSYRVRKVAP